MTSETKIADAVVNTSGQAKRNKAADEYGNKYDCRSGHWGEYDRAVADCKDDLSSWLDKEHCLMELELINSCKFGRPFEYPPSLILFLHMQKEDHDQSYRDLVGDARKLLDALGLPVPCYKTVQRNKEVFFGPEGIGNQIILEADKLLGGRGDAIDPVMFVRSGECPEYTAPQKIPVCQADVDEQKEKDAKAAEMRKSMEVLVNRKYIGKDVECALDGSGEAFKGNGVYFEFAWSINNREFIKQHVLMDISTMEIVSFSITPKTPGDARVMPAIVKGTLKVGVGIANLYADGAYDTVENWKLTEELELDFNPNLKAKFKKDKNLIARHILRMTEEALGKKYHHKISGYNMRWLIESFFSAIKKLYGERVKDRLFKMMAISMTIRYTMYNIRRGYILKYVDPHRRLDDCLTPQEQRG